MLTALCPGHCCCEKLPQVQWHKQQSFAYAPGFSGSGIWIRDGMSLLQDSGLSLGSWTTEAPPIPGGWKHLEASSFTRLAPSRDDWQQGSPGTVNQITYAWSAWELGLLPVWQLGSKRANLQGESSARGPDESCMSFYDLALEATGVPFPIFCWLQELWTCPYAREGTWTPSLSRSVKMP